MTAPSDPPTATAAPAPTAVLEASTPHSTSTGIHYRPAHCIQCGSPFQAMVGPGFAAACCSDDCVALALHSQGFSPTGAPLRKDSQGNAHHKPDPWLAHCSPRYARFDLTRLPPAGRAIARQVLTWDPAETPAQGLGIIGPSDAGKSMLIHEALHRAWQRGWSVLLTSSTEFAWKCGDLDERRPFLHRCIATDLLLIDDIGKEKMTERVESDLYHILEQRERQLKPIAFTANHKGDVLGAQMSQDRADPILNRLRRMARILQV